MTMNEKENRGKVTDHRLVRRHLEEIRDDAQANIDMLAAAWERLLADSDGGFPGSSFGDRVSGTREPDRAIFDRATNPKVDQATEDLNAIPDRTYDAWVAMKDTRRRLARSQPLELEAAKTLTDGRQTCSCCDWPVKGTRDDRLRSGRCWDCWRYWRQHGTDCGLDVHEARLEAKLARPSKANR